MVLKLTGHLIGHAFHVDGLELLLDLFDEAAEVAVLNVGLDKGTQQAVFRGYFVSPDLASDLGDHPERDIWNSLSGSAVRRLGGGRTLTPTHAAGHATGGCCGRGTHARAGGDEDAAEFLDVIALAALDADLDRVTLAAFDGRANIFPADGDLDGV